jgi:acetyl/propionyl-CoA carboxylase alpha subunit
MQNALRDFIVHGVVTNIDFMQAVLKHEDFASRAKYPRAGWRNIWKFGEWTVPEPEAPALHLIAAALADVVFVGGKVTACGFK